MTSTTISTKDKVSLAHWTRAVEQSALQQMLVETSRPGVISFALGLPDVSLFPTDAYLSAVERVIAGGPAGMQYGPPFPPLKAQIVTLMQQRGVDCKEEQIFLTTGAQQGMNLLVRLLLDPGGPVMVEEMSYTGFQQVIEPYRPDILTVPTDPKTGMEVEEVELALRRGKRPSFIYAIADGHNPMAVSMSLEKRVRLVEIASRFGVPIIEDDAYGFFRYEEERFPPMKALDDEIVFYVGTFSKILCPGLRVGWVVVPEMLMPYLSVVKEATDINTGTFTQRTVSAYIDTGHLPGHIDFLRNEYRLRRNTMIRALRKHFQAQWRWETPPSGVFVWVEMPDEIDDVDLLHVSMSEERVAFIPGSAFCSLKSDRRSNYIRLNFSHSTPEIIEEGVNRLAQAVIRLNQNNKE
jgi:2-aminoadipate transaminase